MPSLILANGHTEPEHTYHGALHSSPASPLPPHRSTHETRAGQGCSTVGGEQCHGGSRGISQPHNQAPASAVSRWAMGMRHPCLPAWHMGKWGTQVWAQHSSCIAQARPGWLQTQNNQKHTKGSIVRTSPSMVAECARKSSGQRMPLWSVFVQCSGSATLPV